MYTSRHVAVQDMGHLDYKCHWNKNINANIPGAHQLSYLAQGCEFYHT